MGFDPQAIDEMIRRAGSQLADAWKNPRGQMPENNLHPEPAALQFRIKLMEDRLDLIEKTLGDLVRAYNGRK